jgi:hypothetical protein
MSDSAKNRAIVGELVAKSVQEPAFRHSFISQPEKVLSEAGFVLEPGVKIRVVENSNEAIYMVLPGADFHDQVKTQIQSAIGRLQNLPEGKEVRIVQNTPNLQYIPLPAVSTISESGQLSDEALERVAGGKGGGLPDSVTTTTSTVQTSAAVTSVVAVVEVAAVAVVVAT